MTGYRIARPDTAFSLSSGRKRKRAEEPNHLEWIRTLPCLLTGKRGNIDAAHIRYGSLAYGKRETGKGEKPDDKWSVPLHHDVHMDQHAIGEELWWKGKGIDPLQVAAALYAASGDDQAGQAIILSAQQRKPG